VIPVALGCKLVKSTLLPKLQLLMIVLEVAIGAIGVEAMATMVTVDAAAVTQVLSVELRTFKV
jgi:hypothetical protein